MTKPDFDETVKKIRDWLTEEGTFRCQMPDDNAHSHFQIEFPPGSGHLAEVIFPKPRENIVLIVSGTTFLGRISTSARQLFKTLWSKKC